MFGKSTAVLDVLYVASLPIPAPMLLVPATKLLTFIIKTVRRTFCHLFVSLPLAYTMPTDLIAKRMASVAQVHTQEPGTRALGVASLLIGWDDEMNKPELYR